MDPYRGSPSQAPTSAPALRRRNRWWLWGPAAAIAAGGAIVLGQAEIAEMFAAWIAAQAVVIHVALDASARRKADRVLAQLPFPLVHASGSAWFLPPGQRIALVEVRMRERLDEPDAERAARDLAARVPWLAVRVAGDAFELTRWPGRGDDVATLAELLELWGKDLHARHPIAQAVVTWTTDGPPPSM